MACSPRKQQAFGPEHVGVDHIDLRALLGEAVAGLLQLGFGVVVTALPSEHPPKQRAAERHVVFRTRRSPHADRFAQRHFSFLNAALIEQDLGDVAVRHRHVRQITQPLNEFPGSRIEGNRVVPTSVEIRAISNLSEHSRLAGQVAAPLVQPKGSACSASVNRMPEVHIDDVENRERVGHDLRRAPGVAVVDNVLAADPGRGESTCWNCVNAMLIGHLDPQVLGR